MTRRVGIGFHCLFLRGFVHIPRRSWSRGTLSIWLLGGFLKRVITLVLVFYFDEGSLGEIENEDHVAFLHVDSTFRLCL